MNFLESLKSPDVGPWVINLFFLFIAVLIFTILGMRRKKSERKDKKETSKETKEAKPKAKKKLHWNFSLNPFKGIINGQIRRFVLFFIVIPVGTLAVLNLYFQWFVFSTEDRIHFLWMYGLVLIFGIVPKWERRDILLMILVAIIVLISVFNWYYNFVTFSISQLIFIGLIVGVTVVFATTSNAVRILTYIVASGTVFYLIGLGLYSLNLPGTPHPIKTVTVAEIVGDSIQFIYDVSEPRWTCYTLDIPDNVILDIKAEGIYHWDSLDTRGPIGPEGASWCPNQMLRQHHFISNLKDKPFAGLIGKVGIDGEAFFIGSMCKIEIPKGGDLYIGINYRWRKAGGQQNWRSWWKNAKGKVRISAKWESNPQV